MALILAFINDGKGTEESSDYDIQVMVGDGTEAGTVGIYKGRVEGHPRADGWIELVERFIKTLNDEDRERALSGYYPLIWKKEK